MEDTHRSNRRTVDEARREKLAVLPYEASRRFIADYSSLAAGTVRNLTETLRVLEEVRTLRPPLPKGATSKDLKAIDDRIAFDAKWFSFRRAITELLEQIDSMAIEVADDD